MTKVADKIRVHLATDIKEPVNLHWALSVNRAGEWLVNFLNLLTEKAYRNFKYLTIIAFIYTSLWYFFLHALLVNHTTLTSKLYWHFQEPPPNVLPQGSVSLNGAVETQFVSSSVDSTYEVCPGRHVCSIGLEL